MKPEHFISEESLTKLVEVNKLDSRIPEKDFEGMFLEQTPQNVPGAWIFNISRVVSKNHFSVLMVLQNGKCRRLLVARYYTDGVQIKSLTLIPDEF